MTLPEEQYKALMLMFQENVVKNGWWGPRFFHTLDEESQTIIRNIVILDAQGVTPVGFSDEGVH